ncbi:hypothetical protein G5T41_01970 [Acinetobacter sp. GFQ9D192M]|uniref:Right-handed parallel beta-helix repeat-containing protein n=1 Tax=Acinetobacter variabilis TaxID=70346 RepID=A0A7T8ARG8_9GAMM|nr:MULTISPECIES: NosD domain-containing protein [Acinetobacter]NHB66954.1 hypothetical protein [Acinetobacter sp. GFQ9D191M]NHB99314.1 hypothetical protein [Acinetobacter sp. GFQ9D192M]QQN88779.1 right-handed parallel beta-helix repeat-containing protein [Acinetobacter variabilis]
MESVAIKIVGCSNGVVSGNITNGFDVGVDVQHSENIDISNNSITSRVAGVRVRNSRRNYISNNRVSQIKPDNIFLSITLRDLILFLINNTNIDNVKIIDIYSRLGRSWEEKIYK